jgi:hypothetical protein
MQIDSVLSGVYASSTGYALQQAAARLRPIDEAAAVNKLPESDCQNCGICPNCQAKSEAEQASKAPFGVLDVVELSPDALWAVEESAPAQATNSKQAAEEQTSPGVRSYDELTTEEQEQVDELKARDTEVRQHEQAHLAAAGQYATGGPSYEYQTGPDGNKYAIGGEVQIDTSPVDGDPEATIRKMETVIAAALAPGEPSGQDRSVASQARAALNQARAELSEQQQLEPSGEAQSGSGNTGLFNPAGSQQHPSNPTSQNSPTLYGSDGKSKPTNDGRELARKLDLVA